MSNSFNNLNKITNNSDIQLRTNTISPESVFNRVGCFNEAELIQIRKDALLPIDQVPVSRIKKILNRFDQARSLNCEISVADADAISKFFCLNQEEVEELRRDSKKLPDTLSTQRIEEILKRLKQARENHCEISTLDFEVMKKFIFLLEVQISLRKNQCFDFQLFNDLIRFATEETNRFSDPELSLLIRSITRNLTIKDRYPNANYCKMSSDQLQYYNNLLTALQLERDRRLAHGIPKTVSEQTRLDLLSEEANIVNELTNVKKQLPNLTINQISFNISNTILGILEDLLNPDPSNTMITNLINTFTKDSRPIYIGIALILLSLFIGLFKNIA